MASVTIPKSLAHDSVTPLPVSAHSDPHGLPFGFPHSLSGDLAWTSNDFVGNSSYIYNLTESDIAAIENAVEHFKDLGLDGDCVDSSNFPLPQRLSDQLERLTYDLYHGRGFGLIRGLDPKKYSPEDLTLIYLGIQAYVADQRGRQDAVGNVLVHIIANNSTKQVAAHHRHSTRPITFHNEEAGDIVSWLTRSTANRGGRCIIASAYTVYNFLASSRPDLVRALAGADWPFGLPRFQCRPVLFYDGDKLTMNFGRASLLGSDSCPRPDHFPKLTARQHEALDAIEAIARATEVEIATQAGDIHFINNLTVLHRRDGFVDGKGAGGKRHLVRMRLRSTRHGRAIPDALQKEWEEAFEKPGYRFFHVEPMPLGVIPILRHPN